MLAVADAPKILAVLATLACTPHAQTSGSGDASTTEAAATVQDGQASREDGSFDAAAQSDPVDAEPPAAETPRITAVLTKWNDAHVAHDAAAFGSIYAAQVYFYGQKISSSDAAARKGAAFAKAKDYAQSVRDVVVHKRGDRWVARFTKSSTSGGKTTEYPSVVYVDAQDRVTAEMDALAPQWCHTNPQLVVPPFTINEAQAEAHLLRAYTVGGHPVPVGPDSQPFVQELTCPDPTECASGETRNEAPPDDDRDPPCYFLVRLGVAFPETQKHLGGNGHQWFDLGSWVDGATNVLWWQDALSDASQLWRRDPKAPK
jgi:hypothetical protein